MPSNIDTVIDSIDDTQDDLYDSLRNRVTSSMYALRIDIITNILQDADWTGGLVNSVSGPSVERTADGFDVTVGAGGPAAPQAPLVEFGTGSRTETPYKGSSNIVYEPDSYPPNFPYSAPTMSPGLVANLLEWAQTKSGVEADAGYQIAATVAEQGTFAHPYMRPAWITNERLIRRSARNALRSVT